MSIKFTKNDTEMISRRLEEKFGDNFHWECQFDCDFLHISIKHEKISHVDAEDEANFIYSFMKENGFNDNHKWGSVILSSENSDESYIMDSSGNDFPPMGEPEIKFTQGELDLVLKNMKDYFGTKFKSEYNIGFGDLTMHVSYEDITKEEAKKQVNYIYDFMKENGLNDHQWGARVLIGDEGGEMIDCSGNYYRSSSEGPISIA